MSNMERILRIDYPDDIARLKQAIPSLQPLSDFEVDTLWREYSNDEYAAQFLGTQGHPLSRFEEWLKA